MDKRQTMLENRGGRKKIKTYHAKNKGQQESQRVDREKVSAGLVLGEQHSLGKALPTFQ